MKTNRSLLFILSIGFYLVVGIVIIGFYSPQYSTIPPQGYTGATGTYCNGCHYGNSLNAAGGFVSVTGLPAGTFTASGVYDFTLTTTHSSPNRKKWGFSIIALNAAGTPVGTFSTTNLNAGVNGNELSHKNVITTALQASYTYTNLRWTAPSGTTGNNSTVRFYYVGNAADGFGTSSGDFIYSGLLTANAVATCDTSYWLGTQSAAWEDPANWSCNALPDSNTVIYVNAPAPNYPVLNSNANCKSIHASTGVSVEVKTGFKLNVLGQ